MLKVISYNYHLLTCLILKYGFTCTTYINTIHILLIIMRSLLHCVSIYFELIYITFCNHFPLMGYNLFGTLSRSQILLPDHYSPILLIFVFLFAFTQNRFPFPCNSVRIILLLQCCDIEVNPGPLTSMDSQISQTDLECSKCIRD